MIGAINSAFLQLGLYDTWNMKIRVDEEDCAMLKDKLRTYSILGKAWTRDAIGPVLNFSAKEELVSDHVLLMDDDGKDTELVMDRCNTNHYPFAHNGMSDDSDDLGLSLMRTC